MPCCANGSRTMLVVGLPYNVDGSESGMSGRGAHASRRELTRRYALPVRLVDERYSSLEAETRLKSARERGPAQAARREGRTSMRRRPASSWNAGLRNQT